METWYSPSGHQFSAEVKSQAEDAEETHLQSATQKELEGMIDKYLKSAKFPIEAIQVHYARLVKITSFAVISLSYGEGIIDVWVSYPKPDYRGASKIGREKTGLGSNFVRPTEKNLQTLKEIQARQTQIKILENEKEELTKTFEEPITKKDLLGS